MADDEKSDEAAVGEITHLDFDCRLTSVERIEADPEEDDSDDIFAVKFQVDGPNADAEIEIMVADADDPDVVSFALDILHGALVAWADLIQRRKAEMRTIVSEG